MSAMAMFHQLRLESSSSPSEHGLFCLPHVCPVLFKELAGMIVVGATRGTRRL